MITPKQVYWDNNLVLIWADNSKTEIDFVTLRAACVCAECVDEISGLRKITLSSVSPRITIKDCVYVGNYSLRFFFSDHHSKGIYTFDHLKMVGSLQQKNTTPKSG